MAGTAQHPAARYGRSDDRLMAHVAPGEQIVPKPVLDANPHLAAIIARAIRNAGADPQQYRVGEDMSVNPETGYPEFGFFSRGIGRILKTVAPIALGAIPGVGPILGAVAGGALGAMDGGGVMGGITGAAGGYFGGSALGGAISGAAGAPVAGLIGPTAGGFSGALQGAAAGLSGAGTALGGALGLSGGAVGNVSKVLQAASLFGAGGQPAAIASQKVGDPAPSVADVPQFTAKQPASIDRPASLSALSGYTPEQERSALATKGNNTGLGGDEQSYYRNLLMRSLVGEGGQVNTSNPNALLPIESSYLSKQGYNTSDITELLKRLQG